jgi:MFS family permease
MALAILGDSMLYAVLPAHAASLGIPVAGVGVILSINRWVRIATNFGAAGVFRRIGARAGFTIGSILAVGSTLSYGLFPYFGAMVPARIAWGSAFSLLRLGCYAGIIQESAPTDRGRLMGLYQAISRTGSLVAVLLGGILAGVIGFRATAIAFGLVGLLGLLLAVRFGRRLRPEPAPPPDPTPRPRFELAWTPVNRINAAVLLSAFISPGAAVATIGLLLYRRYGDTLTLGDATIGIAAVAGAFIATKFAADIIISPVFGAISDLLGRRPVAAIASVITVAGLLLLIIELPLGLLALGAVLIYIAAAGLYIVLETWAADLAGGGDWRARMSAFATARDVGSALAPMLAFALAAVVSLAWVYAGCILLALLVLAILPPSPCAGILESLESNPAPPIKPAPAGIAEDPDARSLHVRRFPLRHDQAGVELRGTQPDRPRRRLPPHRLRHLRGHGIRRKARSRRGRRLFERPGAGPGRLGRGAGNHVARR